MDLREVWDLNKRVDRNRLLEYVREKKPAFVIGRPQCKMFSKLQSMNERTGKRRQQYNEAVGHMKFVFECISCRFEKVDGSYTNIRRNQLHRS